MAKNTELQRFVDEIEAIEADTKEMNDRKSDVYKDAKGKGYEIKILKEVVGIRRKRRKDGAQAIEDHNNLVDTYLQQLD